MLSPDSVRRILLDLAAIALVSSVVVFGYLVYEVHWLTQQTTAIIQVVNNVCAAAPDACKGVASAARPPSPPSTPGKE